MLLFVLRRHPPRRTRTYSLFPYTTLVRPGEMAVKPMNCPASTYVYATQKRAYRDLPIRYADFGRLHRYEKSGVVTGLFRVRTFVQDDAHIFCRPDQIQEEVTSLIRLVQYEIGRAHV